MGPTDRGRHRWRLSTEQRKRWPPILHVPPLLLPDFGAICTVTGDYKEALNGLEEREEKVLGRLEREEHFPFATPLPQTRKNGTNTDKFKENISFVFKPSFMGRGSSLRTLLNIGWLQKGGKETCTTRKRNPPLSIQHLYRRERGAAAVAASGEYHLSSFGASSAKRDFPHSLVPPPSLRIQPAWRERERAECVTGYTPKRHRKATYSFLLSEKNPEKPHCGSTSFPSPPSTWVRLW